MTHHDAPQCCISTEPRQMKHKISVLVFTPLPQLQSQSERFHCKSTSARPGKKQLTCPRFIGPQKQRHPGVVYLNCLFFEQPAAFTSISAKKLTKKCNTEHQMLNWQYGAAKRSSRKWKLQRYMRKQEERATVHAK